MLVSLGGDKPDDEEDSHDEVRQDLSTKVMNYEQIMASLGKKTLKVKMEERRKKEEEKARAEELKRDEMRIRALYGAHLGGHQMMMPLTMPTEDGEQGNDPAAERRRRAKQVNAELTNIVSAKKNC